MGDVFFFLLRMKGFSISVFVQYTQPFGISNKYFMVFCRCPDSEPCTCGTINTFLLHTPHTHSKHWTYTLSGPGYYLQGADVSQSLTSKYEHNTQHIQCTQNHSKATSSLSVITNNTTHLWALMFGLTDPVYVTLLLKWFRAVGLYLHPVNCDFLCPNFSPPLSLSGSVKFTHCVLIYPLKYNRTHL